MTASGHSQEKARCGWEKLFAGLTEEFGGGEPDKFAARRDHALELDEGDARFLERRDVVLGTDGGGDEVIEMRRVTEDEDGG